MSSRGTGSRGGHAGGNAGSGSSRDNTQAKGKAKAKDKDSDPGKRLIEDLNGQAADASEILGDIEEMIHGLGLEPHVKREWHSRPEHDSGSGKAVISAQDVGTAEASGPDFRHSPISSSDASFITNPSLQSTSSTGIHIMCIRPGTTYKELRDFFRPIGELTHIHTDTGNVNRRPWAMVRFKTVELARKAMEDLENERPEFCGGRKIRMEAYRESLRPSHASGTPSTPAQLSSNQASRAVSPLPTDSTNRPVLTAGGRSQRPGATETTLPVAQQADGNYSAVLKLDNINASWSNKDITMRLLDVLRASPELKFEPQPVRLKTLPQEVNNSVLLRFKNAEAAAQAGPIISRTKLNGSIPVRVNRLRNSNRLSSFLTGHIQLDNVPSSWRASDVKARVIFLTSGEGYVFKAEQLTTPRYQGTLSYVLTLAFPDTTRVLVGKLHGQILAGLKVEATVLP